ncbi:MAG: hypothetical protein K2Z80_22630 [Xanthobacteraceae bacterium]|nr:hypothetical protein [Xanthobacteraceae bacterium]
MRKLLIGAVAATGLALASVPASAQFYAGADPGGVGVQVGPFGVGVGPRYGWYGHDHHAYGYGDCRIVRERSVTPSGRVIVERRRVCY